MTDKHYLKNARLAEVLALIQVLAFDQYTSRSEKGLSEELQANPASAKNWVKLAKEHPEFFRVRDDEEKKDLVSLVSRFVLPKIKDKNGNATKNRLPLSDNSVNKLMDIAIEIHDRQLAQRDRWKLYTPIIVAVIAAAVKFLLSNET